MPRPSGAASLGGSPQTPFVELPNLESSMNPTFVGSRAWRRTVVAAAAGLCLASAVMAQQSLGSINGRAAKGDSVSAEDNVGRGQIDRRLASDQDRCRWLFPDLPVAARHLYGHAHRANGSKETTQVYVTAGEGATATFGASQVVQITGTAIRTIDARATESVTSLSKAEIDRIPVTRNVTAVTLLAPGAVVGDLWVTPGSGRPPPAPATCLRWAGHRRPRTPTTSTASTSPTFSMAWPSARSRSKRSPIFR